MDEFISRDDVQAIAKLARLRLTDAEVEPLRRDLTAILQHMEALRELDTEGVAPMTHVIPVASCTRPDTVAPSLSASVALAQAPRRSDDFFVVPNVIASGDTEPGS